MIMEIFWYKADFLILGIAEHASWWLPTSWISLLGCVLGPSMLLTTFWILNPFGSVVLTPKSFSKLPCVRLPMFQIVPCEST